MHVPPFWHGKLAHGLGRVVAVLKINSISCVICCLAYNESPYNSNNNINNNNNNNNNNNDNNKSLFYKINTYILCYKN